MSDLNLKRNSSIELLEIRKLDILLTQCETSSCENICQDCCEILGSIETMLPANVSNQSDPEEIIGTTSNLSKHRDGCRNGDDAVERDAIRFDVTNDDESRAALRLARQRFATKLHHNAVTINQIETVDPNGKSSDQVKRNLESTKYYSLDKERTERQNYEKFGVDNPSNVECTSDYQLGDNKKHCVFKSIDPKKENQTTTTKSQFTRKLSVIPFRNYFDGKGSSKSSQQSVRGGDCNNGKEMTRSKFSSHRVGQKLGSKHHSEDHEQSDRDALLSKYESFHMEKKLPEPVETVRNLLSP